MCFRSLIVSAFPNWTTAGKYRVIHNCHEWKVKESTFLRTMSICKMFIIVYVKKKKVAAVVYESFLDTCKNVTSGGVLVFKSRLSGFIFSFTSSSSLFHSTKLSNLLTYVTEVITTEDTKRMCVFSIVCLLITWFMPSSPSSLHGAKRNQHRIVPRQVLTTSLTIGTT